jgi:hypothetical protein
MHIGIFNLQIIFEKYSKLKWTHPNNLDMATFEFLLEWDLCVYQGITILMNLAYQNKVMHKWLQLISSKEDVQSNHVMWKFFYWLN